MSTIEDHIGLDEAERLRKAVNPLGWLLYPDLMHRRACEAMRASAGSVRDKQEAAGSEHPTASSTSTYATGSDGRSRQCA
jgi:hypothetical protein